MFMWVTNVSSSGSQTPSDYDYDRLMLGSVVYSYACSPVEVISLTLSIIIRNISQRRERLKMSEALSKLKPIFKKTVKSYLHRRASMER